MPQQINKKILLYLFLFIILGTFNNKKINKFDFPEIDSIQIDGLETDNGNFLKKIESLNLGNIFFLKNILLTELFESNNIIEEYKIFKKYPSSLEVKVIETKFLALTKINQKTFFVGSNGKLIEVKENLKKLPFIFGELDINKFLSLKKIIDESNLDFQEIKNLYFFPSGRWDIKTNKDILIKLPQKNLLKALNLSHHMITNENFKNNKIIDLRIYNNVILTNE